MKLDPTGLTIEQRRAQIVSRLLGSGTPTYERVQAVADIWGLNANVYEFQYPLFQMGLSKMGDPLRGDIWAVTLLVIYDGPQNLAFEASVRSIPQATTNILFQLAS